MNRHNDGFFRDFLNEEIYEGLAKMENQGLIVIKKGLRSHNVICLTKKGFKEILGKEI